MRAAHGMTAIKLNLKRWWNEHVRFTGSCQLDDDDKPVTS
jgi:hypothetical protein